LEGEIPRPFSFSPIVQGHTRLAYSPTCVHSLPDIDTVLLYVSDPEHSKAGKGEPFLNGARPPSPGFAT
jgi:hypothetical protein